MTCRFNCRCNKLNKTLVSDYLKNPDQTMIQLARKYGMKTERSASYHITKYFKMNVKQRKEALR
jgi:hypothetical protein